MRLKMSSFVGIFLYCIVFAISCTKKENKNLETPTTGLDPRINTFFNAVGLPLTEMNGMDMESVTADLSRVSPLFTNALPPKIPDDMSSKPFFILAKNVGLYFTSQIWKTQLTGPEDVKFFDLSSDVVSSSSKINYKSSNFNLPFVFLNPYADTPEKKQYVGSVLNGQYGKYENPMILQGFHAMSHLYIMEYKLRDEHGSRDSQNVRTYYALVSVPLTTGEHRLIMYAHAGDFGTSSSELITIFNDKLKDFVVVAPLFPGEPLCTQINMQNQGCLRLDAKNNLVKDTIGQYTNPDLDILLNSIVPIAYSRSPLQEDINAFLGAHNAVSRVMNLSLVGSGDHNPLYTVLKPFNQPEKLVNVFQNLDDNGAQMVPEGNSAPETIGVGSSRGGGVLLVALGRIGFLMNGISADTPFNHEVDGFKFQYPIFNGAAFFFPPTSMLTGKMRLFTIMLLQSKLDSIANMPMAVDLAHNEYFTNFRNDENYLSEIQLPLADESGKFVEPAKDTLTRLVTYVAASDVTFLAPFLATALQNWNTYSNEGPGQYAKPIRAPGSLIFLHGSQDAVVPMTESTIGMQAMNTVWAGLYHTSSDPYGNYLHDLKFAAMHGMLKSSFIPGVGAAQFTFQPTNEFFNEPCDKNTMAAIQQPNVIYNSDVGRCFGGGFSPKADGKNTVSKFYGHFDASFFTGRLVNSITPENLHLSFLSSNYNDYKSYTMQNDASAHMKYGGPLVKEGEPCLQSDEVCEAFAFPYNVATLSPTFMRYMAEEGNPTTNIVAAKKQIFEGEFKPGNTSPLQPLDVLFGWLDSVACDWCEVDSGKNDEPLFQQHFGIFHDFAKN